jgi:hypothetical protein
MRRLLVKGVIEADGIVTDEVGVRRMGGLRVGEILGGGRKRIYWVKMVQLMAIEMVKVKGGKR